MLKATVHSSMRAVEAARWDAVGSDPLSAHAVLAALEDARLPGVRLWPVTLEDTAGRWVAAAPFAQLDVDGAKLTRGVFRRGVELVRTARPRFLKTSLMICGTPLSVGNPPARVTRPSDAPGAYAELARALDEHADREGVPWRAFKELPGSSLPVAEAALGRFGWTLAPSEPGALISIFWNSYEDYLKSLRSPYRRKIRLAERDLAASGIRIDVVPLGEGYGDAIHALYEDVVDRAPIQLERLTSRFFIELGRTAGDDATLIRFRKGTRVVGWVAMLFAEGVAYDLFHGIDYRENERASLYFNQIAAAIGHAIERGARTVSLGQSSETAKARFGADPAPLWIALRHQNAVVSAALCAGRRQLFPTKPHPARRVFARNDALPAGSAR